MEAIPYELAGAVKDLHDLLQQINPAGPYRMALFHDREERKSSQPKWFSLEATQIDSYLRGAVCLLANDLADSSLPVIAMAWKHIKSTAFRIGFAKQPEPAYFRYLSTELSTGERRSKAEAYRLLGEALAVHLDMLCSLGFDRAGIVAPKVDMLRALLTSVSTGSHNGRPQS